MENVRNRVNVKLVINENAFNKLAKKPSYKGKPYSMKTWWQFTWKRPQLN